MRQRLAAGWRIWRMQKWQRTSASRRLASESPSFTGDNHWSRARMADLADLAAKLNSHQFNRLHTK
jgi:hypothetical protein